MKNRRIFQRNDCSIPVIAHLSGKFLYGEIVDLSLGGVKISVKGKLETDRVELVPNRKIPEGSVVIPLPYDVKWRTTEEVGLQFSGGTDAFFRGWLSEHLNPPGTGFASLLDQRELVRISCQLEGSLCLDDQTSECAILDLSVGGLSFVAPGELLPGMSASVTLDQDPELGVLEFIILRVQPLSGFSLCGGRFLEPQDHQIQSLERLVAKLATGRGPDLTGPD